MAARVAILKDAAKAGKAVLMQKPMATDLKTAEEMVQIAEDGGIPYAVNQNLRFDPAIYLTKQFLWFGLAALACLVVSRIDLEDARRHVWVFAAICLVGLVLVLVPGIGIEVKGSRRWLGFGPVRLQISELAKLAMVFGLAHYLALSQTRIQEFVRGFVAPLAWISAVWRSW